MHMHTHTHTRKAHTHAHMCMLVHTDADQIARKPAIDTNQKKSRKATESKNSLIKNTLSEPFRPANQASGPGGCLKLKNFSAGAGPIHFTFLKKEIHFYCKTQQASSDPKHIPTHTQQAQKNARSEICTCSKWPICFTPRADHTHHDLHYKQIGMYTQKPFRNSTWPFA